eukprot:3526649-Prymnesium_polylepis.1
MAGCGGDGGRFGRSRSYAMARSKSTTIHAFPLCGLPWYKLTQSAKKPPDFGQGLRLIGIHSHDKLYGEKMPLDLRSALHFWGQGAPSPIGRSQAATHHR